MSGSGDQGSRLAGARYEARSLDLVHLRHDPTDAAIGEIVHGAAAAGARELAEFRASLSEGEMYALVAFAKRSAALALRSQTLSPALDAIEALTLIDRSKIDYRDLSPDLPVLAARDLGADNDALLDRAIERSEHGTAKSFAAARDRAQTATIESCGYRVVRTPSGPGLMWGSWYAYGPSAPLAEFAVGLSDVIEAEGTYLPERLEFSTLPAVWLDRTRTDEIATSGCVLVDGPHLEATQRWSHGLMVFLAEVADPSIASDLAVRAHRASSADRPRTAISIDRLVVLFVGGSATANESPLETSASLDRFSTIVRPWLAGRISG